MGGVSGIIVLILALVFGINPSEIMGGGGGSASGAASGTDMSQCQTGADVAKDRECRFVVYANSVNEYWSQTLQGYQPAKTVLFSGQTATGCGTATTDVGPFYCPTDKQVYLDPTFTQDMLQGQLGGMGGDAAEAYVIGHEYGHHVQDLRGVLAQVQQSGNATGANSPQVKLELQADRLAGAYLASVTRCPTAPSRRSTRTTSTASWTPRRSSATTTSSAAPPAPSTPTRGRTAAPRCASTGWRRASTPATRRSATTSSPPTDLVRAPRRRPR